MILEQEILPFIDWIGPAVRQWFISVGVLLAVALVIGFILCTVRFGVSGFGAALQRSITNLTSISPRRIWAIARLTIKESLRRRVLLVFVLFMLILLVAAWYLDPNSEDPAALYMTFVLWATMIMVLLLSLFLSSFSLPTDFKNKTIYSVVTKPVRSSELVVGRILGISLIGTLMLVLMGTASYFFVFSGLKHTHILTEREDLTPAAIEAGENADDVRRVVFRGETRLTNRHKHPVTVYADGRIVVGKVNGHTHEIETKAVETQVGGTQTRYIVHDEQGTLQARVPIYGKLGFRGKDGMDTDKGINVGHEWEYRSYIGAGEEASVFVFENMRQTLFPRDNQNFANGLPVEMTLGVFRTHKGTIENRVSASVSVRNPETGLMAEVMTFSTEEFITKSLAIPWTFDGTPQVVQRRGRNENREFYTVPDDATAQKERDAPQFSRRREFDLFKDFVSSKGQIEIWLQCVDRGQYIGVAQSDLYLRANDGSIFWNFVKGFYGIWMQMLVITAFGVLFSTFLSGPVAMISTVGVMIAGFSKAFMIQIGLNKVLGGGPFESLYRLLIQQNMVVDLPKNFATTFIQSADKVYGSFMYVLSQAIPPLSDYAVYNEAVVKGFNIDNGWLLNHTVMTFAYAVPLFIVAYLILSNREVAK